MVYYEVDEITVTATKNASSATVEITPVDSNPNKSGHQVALINVGSTLNPDITVTCNEWWKLPKLYHHRDPPRCGVRRGEAGDADPGTVRR